MPEEIEEANVNSAKLLNSQLQVLFGVDFFPLDQADAEHSTNSEEEEDEVGIGFLKFPALFLSIFSSVQLVTDAAKKNICKTHYYIFQPIQIQNAHCK